MRTDPVNRKAVGWSMSLQELIKFRHVYISSHAYFDEKNSEYQQEWNKGTLERN